MLATMVDRGWKISKLHRLKCPKTFPVPIKRILYQKLNDLKPHTWNLSNNFRFSGRKSQSQEKLAKRITHFTVRFRSKNLTHFTKLNSLSIRKNILSQHSQKHYSLYKFSSKHVFGWCQKKHFHWKWRPRTAFPKHLERKCVYVPVNLRKKMFVSET